MYLISLCFVEFMSHWLLDKNVKLHSVSLLNDWNLKFFSLIVYFFKIVAYLQHWTEYNYKIISPMICLENEMEHEIQELKTWNH